MKTVYLVADVNFVLEPNITCFDSMDDIPKWVHEKVKMGVTNLEELQISEDHYRFNPQAISYFHDVHKIKNSDKFLLLTSSPDGVSASVRTFEQLKEMNDSDSDYYYYRFSEAIEEIEI